MEMLLVLVAHAVFPLVGALFRELGEVDGLLVSLVLVPAVLHEERVGARAALGLVGVASRGHGVDGLTAAKA